MNLIFSNGILGLIIGIALLFLVCLIISAPYYVWRLHEDVKMLKKIVEHMAIKGIKIRKDFEIERRKEWSTR